MENLHPVTLVATSVLYYSQGDERSFFAWLKRIACVGHFNGVGQELRITIGRPPKDNELRELIALFHRYKIDMAQLAQFETNENAPWFRSRGTFWHVKTFGRAKDPAARTIKTIKVRSA